MKMMHYDAHIRDAYKSLHEPDYSFVSKAVEQARYAEIGPSLSELGCTVVDDTDLTTDVCRTLIVTKGDLQALVRLSFAGPFAAVCQLNGEAEKLKFLMPFLADRGLSVLSQAVLELPYEIALLDLEEKPTVYNALFSTDPMPSSSGVEAPVLNET